MYSTSVIIRSPSSLAEVCVSVVVVLIIVGAVLVQSGLADRMKWVWISFFPDRAMATTYYQRGVSALKFGDTGQAFENFTAATRYNPQYAEAWLGQSQVLFNNGKEAAAMAALNRSIALKADYFDAYVTRGVWYKHKGEWAKVIADMNRAIQMKPDYNATLYVMRGLAYANTGQLEQALLDYNHAVDLDYGDYEAFYARATLLQAQGKLDEALADYNRAVELNYLTDQVYLGRCAVYFAKGMTQEALADCDLGFGKLQPATILQPNPALAQAYYDRALAHYTVFAQARSDLTNAIRLNSAGYRSYLFRGKLYLDQGLLKEAIDDLTKAVDLGIEPLDRPIIEQLLPTLKEQQTRLTDGEIRAKLEKLLAKVAEK